MDLILLSAFGFAGLLKLTIATFLLVLLVLATRWTILRAISAARWVATAWSDR